MKVLALVNPKFDGRIEKIFLVDGLKHSGIEEKVADLSARISERFGGHLELHNVTIVPSIGDILGEVEEIVNGEDY